MSDELTGAGSAGSGMGGALSDPRTAGSDLLKQGRFDEAAAVLKEAVLLDPMDESAWRLLGAALAQKGDNAGAVDAFRKTVEIVPMAAKNHYNLAIALQGAGRVPEARAALEQALSLDPGYDQAKQRLMELGGGPAPMAQLAAPPPPTTNLGGATASASLLSGIGNQYVPPADTGTTNLAGGNLGGLSSVGNVGPAGPLAPPSAPSLRPAAPISAPPLMPPSSGSFGAPQSGYAPSPVLGMNYGSTENTSGMKGEVPPEIAKGFNWGAFLMNWLWLINMRLVGWGVGYLVGSIVLSLAIGDNRTLRGLLNIVSFGVSISIGVMGNKLAWQNRRFDSVEDFRACQRVWMYWGIGLVAFWIIIFVLAAVFVGAAVFALLSGGAKGARP